MRAISSAVIVGGTVRFSRNCQASVKSTRATPPVPAFQCYVLQCHPAIFRLGWCALQQSQVPQQRTVVSRKQMLFNAPLPTAQLFFLFSSLHNTTQHNTNKQYVSHKQLSHLIDNPPLPKCRGGISFLASVQEGFTPRTFGFVPATKITTKTALQGPHLSTTHDGLVAIVERCIVPPESADRTALTQEGTKPGSVDERGFPPNPVPTTETAEVRCRRICLVSIKHQLTPK